MNYPVWDVPYIGLPWVVGIIAIFHVMISHFAVGGGLYLAMAEHRAVKTGRSDWLVVLRGHSKFFLVLTGVFGAVSGVGIWFAIGLASPEATSTLIHNFVFGWAIEWVFFIVELSAAAVYYYTWDRIPAKLHLQVGWLYAIASVLTLVIINGILTFMLTPGTTWLSVAGTGNESSVFWSAFFNPTYWPSLFMRVLVCLALAGVWALVSYSRLDDTTAGQAKDEMVRWSAKWLWPAFGLMPFVFAWYILQVPAENKHLLELGMTTIGSGGNTQVTRLGLVSILSSATIAAIVYFLAYRCPRDFTYGHAVSVLFIALLATGSTEYAREAVRKPYVIGSHMYSNGLRTREVASMNANGYMSQSAWKPSAGHSKEQLGQAVFRGQCMSCHTVDGYRSMKKFLAQRDAKAVGNVVKMLREYKEDSPYKAFMPPLVGSDEEVAALEAYLVTLSGVRAQASPVARR